MKKARHDLSAVKGGGERRGLWGFLLNELFQNADAAIVCADKKGKIVFGNAEYRNRFGITDSGMIGKKWVDIIVAEDMRGEVAERFGSMHENTAAFEFESPAYGKKGEEERFNWVVNPLKWGDDLFVILAGRPHENPKKRREFDIKPATHKEILHAILSGSRSKEPEIAVHSLKVMSLAVSLAKKMGLSKQNIENLKLAARLHDIGKLAIDGRILYKKGKLDAEEFEKIKKHPTWSVEIIKPFLFFEPVLAIIGSHHENYDGSGYPAGLKGEAIPLESRILTVTDIYAALTADRSYRSAFTKEEAMRIVEEAKGWKTDPGITDIFLDMARNNELDE